MKKETIKQVIREWQFSIPQDLLRRELSIPLNSGKIITLVGARRSGKTSCLYNISEALHKNGLSRENILYINFEDERLDLTTETLDLVLQAYLELYPQIDISACYLLFDEIQNIDNWDKFIRRIYDTQTKNILITGSSARMLSSEIATSLRGRTVSYEIFPFSFREYLSYRKIAPELYAAQGRAGLNSALDDYLCWGGFPEIINASPELRTRILQEYFNVMIYRDLVERYEIKNLPALRFFLKRVLSSATKQVSVNKIYNDLKSAGHKIGKNQLYEYLDACQDIHLAFLCRKITSSPVDRELGEKKIYAIDNGLLNAVHYRFSDDLGKALEQAVFLELKRKEKNIYYFKGRHECDFVLKEGPDAVQAIQVVTSLAEESVKKREIRGLLECCRALRLSAGLIITRDDDPAEIISDDIKISVTSLSRWLLG